MLLNIKLSIFFALCCCVCVTQVQARYLGRLSDNPYEADSIANPYGRYGSRHSPDSINNPYGVANPYNPDSPRNAYGRGWEIRYE